MSEPYRVSRFERGRIPAGLRSEHSLRAGVRGVLTVVSGSLVFVSASGRVSLSEGETHDIEPEVRHHLEDAEDAAIEIAFHRVG